MAERLLYATTNPGKIFEVGKHLESFGINILSPNDLGLSIDVDETGQTLEENAKLKVGAYMKAAKDKIVIADDTGEEIDALGGEPGIHVRRWKDGMTRLTDREIIEYCLDRMRGIPLAKRGARFRTVLALGVPGGQIELFEGILRGVILEEPKYQFKMEGFPFETLFFVPEWDMVLGQVHQLADKEKSKYKTHRERAIETALPRIRELI